MSRQLALGLGRTTRAAMQPGAVQRRGKAQSKQPPARVRRPAKHAVAGKARHGARAHVSEEARGAGLLGLP